MSNRLNKLLQSLEQNAYQLPFRTGKELAYRRGSAPLWRRVKEFNHNDEPSSATPDKRLIDFFNLAENNRERAFLGNLMYEQGLRLPLKYEIRLIESLLHEQDAHNALKLWQSRSSLKKQNHKWDVIGIKCLMACHRYADAERIVANTELITEPKIAVEFVHAYAQQHGARAIERLKYWLEQLRPAEKRQLLPTLIRNQHMDIAQSIASVDPPAFLSNAMALSTALRSSKTVPDPVSFVSALAKKPGLVNNSVFKEAWARSSVNAANQYNSEKTIALTARVLLEQNRTDEALELMDHCNARVYVEILNACAKTNDIATLQKAMKHARGHMKECLSKQGQESRYVHFLIKGSLVEQDCEGALASIPKLKIDSTTPLFRLDYRVYKLIWSTLKRGLNSGSSSARAIDLRALFKNTINMANCVLDEALFDDILSVFMAAGDTVGALAAARVGVASVPGYELPASLRSVKSLNPLEQ